MTANTALIEPMAAGRFEVPTPAEVNRLAGALLRQAGERELPPTTRRNLAEAIALFQRGWTRCFEQFGQNPAGELAYRDLILELEERAAAQPWVALALNGLGLVAPRSPVPQALARRRKLIRRQASGREPPVFDRPLFIISAPRSGSTLLFETLAGFPDLWTVGEESHELIEGIPELHPAARGYASNRLEARDATPTVTAVLRERIASRLRDRTGRAYADLPETERPARPRLLEKTPKNALRIPFLRAAFPDARFLVLHRRPEETLASLLDGWRGRGFNAYQPLPGWPHRAWKFLLVPGWEQLADRPLAEIVAQQWRLCYETILADLKELPGEAWLPVRYADLVADPVASLRRIADFAGLALDPALERTWADGLPLSSMTFSAPDPDKWRRHEATLEPVLPGLRVLAAAVENLGHTRRGGG